MVQSKKQDPPPAEPRQQSDSNKHLSDSECNHTHSFILNLSVACNETLDRLRGLIEEYKKVSERRQEPFKKWREEQDRLKEEHEKLHAEHRKLLDAQMEKKKRERAQAERRERIKRRTGFCVVDEM
jgi:hypothetical protein